MAPERAVLTVRVKRPGNITSIVRLLASYGYLHAVALRWNAKALTHRLTPKVKPQINRISSHIYCEVGVVDLNKKARYSMSHVMKM